MRVKLFFSAIIAIFFFTACNLINGSAGKKDNAVARVYDKYLYANDLKGLVPAGTGKNDSIEITSAYINNWVRQELLLKQASDNLEPDAMDFEKQIEQYRNSLIIFAYESELVKQKLDTIVSMADIETYYKDNQNNFLLRENIVLADYIILDKASPLESRIKMLFQSKREPDREKLLDLCNENNIKLSLNQGSWMSFTELSRTIPLSVNDQQEFLAKNKFYEVKDSTTQYLVSIEAYKVKESISPLSFEVNNIKSIILIKRKAEMLKRMEDDLYNDAVKRNKYEIFKK